MTFPRGWILFIFFVAAGLAGCAGGFKVLSPKQISEHPYLLQPGDQLEISVWGQTQINHKTTLGEDGLLLFPGLEEMQASGRSPEEIEKEIQAQLVKKYLPAEVPEGETPAASSQRLVSPVELRDFVYRLLPGDTLSISVWNHSELNKEVALREDGTFPFPLIGEVRAAGQSLREVERQIAQQLNKDYIVDPAVTATFSKTNFTVLGQVARPGAYPTDGTLDLLAALSLAGGVTPGNFSEIELIRPVGLENWIVRLEQDQVFEGKQPNLRVFPHDTIHVKTNNPEGFQVSVVLTGAKFTAIGEVGSPGQYPVEGPLDLLTAVSQAGGVTKFGSSRIEIIRQRGNERWIIRADIDRILKGKQPNVRIHPHDLLNVKRRFI